MTSSKAKSHRSTRDDLDSLLFDFLSSIAAILVSTGYGFSRVNKLTKMAFVRAANSVELDSGTQLSIARIAALTGLTRTDVSQMVRLRGGSSLLAGRPENRLARVARGWAMDAKFVQKGHGPRPLDFAGSGNTFSKLVKKYSGDIPPKAMLSEMMRLGMAKRDSRGKLILVRSEVAHSRRTTDALKAAIPLINFLASETTSHERSELTSRSNRIELRFSSIPQLLAAMRELHGRHSAFVAALEELGSRKNAQSRYAINVSVAVAATNPQFSPAVLRTNATAKKSRTKNETPS